jgi:hypothetical protein
MESAGITVESVRNLQASGKHLLEDLLGRQLLEDQQVFIMVLSPGSDPDEEARQAASASLEAVFPKTTAHAAEHGASDDEIDAAVREAAGSSREGLMRVVLDSSLLARAKKDKRGTGIDFIDCRPPTLFSTSLRGDNRPVPTSQKTGLGRLNFAYGWRKIRYTSIGGEMKLLVRLSQGIAVPG